VVGFFGVSVSIDVSHVQSYFWRKWFANWNCLCNLDRNWRSRKRFDGNLFL